MYKPRTISFNRVLDIDEWKVKVYTISKGSQIIDESHLIILSKHLVDWLKMKNSFNAEHDYHAFVIVHFGTEGIFTLVNWWVDKYMLNTHIFFSEHDDRGTFRLISGDGLAPCIWEMEVIIHERESWTKQVLKSKQPDFRAYLRDKIEGSY